MPKTDAFPAHREWRKRVPNWARESDHAVIALASRGEGISRPEHALEELLREEVTLYLEYLDVTVPQRVVETALALISDSYIRGQEQVRFTLSKEHLHGFLTAADKRLSETIPHALIEEAASRAYLTIAGIMATPFALLPPAEHAKWTAGVMQGMHLTTEWERKRVADWTPTRFWPEPE